MFEGLSEKLSGIFDTLTRRGALSEEDVNVALREVRRALLEADVALDVVRSFVDKVRARAVGANVIKSVTPGQMVVKIVNDELVAMLGSDADPISLAATPPVGISGACGIGPWTALMNCGPNNSPGNTFTISAPASMASTTSRTLMAPGMLGTW